MRVRHETKGLFIDFPKLHPSSTVVDQETRRLRRDCPTCGKGFSKRTNLKRHIKDGVCQHRVASSDNDESCENQPLTSFSCNFCPEVFDTQFNLSLHMLIHTHNNDSYRNGTSSINLVNVSLENVVRDYIMETTEGPIIDFSQWFHQNVNIIEALFNNLNNFRMKALIYLKIKYLK